jgi:hypothetical protein
MHQLVSANLDSSRRWAVLAIVVAAQFMFGVDAFIVNVALPTIPARQRSLVFDLKHRRDGRAAVNGKTYTCGFIAD